MSQRREPAPGAGGDGAAPATRVTLRPAVMADCERIWLWRNDPATRRASFDPSPISFGTHQEWFRACLERADRKLYTILAKGVKCGVVRLDISGSEADVSINVAREWRHRGVGRAALQALVDLAFGSLGLERLVALIKPENQASLLAFRKAGFTLAGAKKVVTLAKTRNEG